MQQGDHGASTSGTSSLGRGKAGSSSAGREGTEQQRTDHADKQTDTSGESGAEDKPFAPLELMQTILDEQGGFDKKMDAVRSLKKYRVNDEFVRKLKEIALERRGDLHLMSYPAIIALSSKNHISGDFAKKLDKIYCDPERPIFLDAVVIALSSNNHIIGDFAEILKNVALNPNYDVWSPRPINDKWSRYAAIEALSSNNHIIGDFAKKLKNVALNPKEDVIVQMAAKRAIGII